MCMQTWVVSADFSKANDFAGASALNASLSKVGFKNLLLFTHNKVCTVNGQVLDVPIFTYRNPMSLSSRVARSLFRKINSDQIRRMVLNNLNPPHSFMIPHNLRHFLYLKILPELPQGDFVFVVDSRDLIFQVSPEEISQNLTESGSLHFFDERKTYFKSRERQQKVLYSDTNKLWINQLFNFKQNEWVSSNEWIVNSGCIAGRVEALERFFDSTTRLIASSSWRYDSILDQAATNVLSREEKFDAKIHPNGEITLNMCGVIEGKCETSAGSFLVNGKPVPIVHQWDRFGFYDVEIGLQLDKRKYQDIHLDGEKT